MKNFSKTKKLLSILMVITILAVPFSVCATPIEDFVYEEITFDSIKTVLGDNYGINNSEEGAGKFVFSPTGVGGKVSKNIISLYGVEDGYAYIRTYAASNTYGVPTFSWDFSEKVKEKQLKDWLAENELLRLEEVEETITDEENNETTVTVIKGVKLVDEVETYVDVEVPEFDGIIKSGKWAFEYRPVTSTNNGNDRVFICFNNGTQDVFALENSRYSINTKYSVSPNINQTANATNAIELVDAKKNFDGALSNGWNYRIVLDFDTNTFNFYGHEKENEWSLLNKPTSVPVTDEQGNPMTDEDGNPVTEDLAGISFDLSKGISEFVHKYRYSNSYDGNYKLDYIALSEINDDGTTTTLDRVDFDGTSHDFSDYGCKIERGDNHCASVYIKDNALMLANTSTASTKKNVTLEYELDKPISSGIWAVDFDFIALGSDGVTGRYPAWLDPNEADTEGTIYPLIAIDTENDASSFISFATNSQGNNSALYYSVDQTKPEFGIGPNLDGSSVARILTGDGRYRLIYDFNNKKIWVYATVSAGGSTSFLLLNSSETLNGYDIPEGFDIDKFRIALYTPAYRDLAYVGVRDFKITRLDKADDYSNTGSYYNDGPCDPASDYVYVSKDGIIKTEALVYAPAKKRTVNIITAVYDADGKIVDVKCDTSVINDGLSKISSAYTIPCEMTEGMMAKVFVLDSATLKPLSKLLDYFALTE